MTLGTGGNRNGMPCHCGTGGHATGSTRNVPGAVGLGSKAGRAAALGLSLGDGVGKGVPGCHGVTGRCRCHGVWARFVRRVRQLRALARKDGSSTEGSARAARSWFSLGLARCGRATCGAPGLCRAQCGEEQQSHPATAGTRTGTDTSPARVEQRARAAGRNAGAGPGAVLVLAALAALLLRAESAGTGSARLPRRCCCPTGRCPGPRIPRMPSVALSRCVDTAHHPSSSWHPAAPQPSSCRAPRCRPGSAAASGAWWGWFPGPRVLT